MNRKKEQEEDLMTNIATPGKDDDTKEDMHFEHYTDTHDASTVWAEDPGQKGKKRH
jgi:hypothetical protein